MKLRHLFESLLTFAQAQKLAIQWLTLIYEGTSSIVPGTGNCYHNAKTNQFIVNVIIDWGLTKGDAVWVVVSTKFSTDCDLVDRYPYFYDDVGALDYVNEKRSMLSSMHADNKVQAQITAKFGEWVKI